MVYDQFKTTVWTEGCSYDFCEFVDCIDITQDRWKELEYDFTKRYTFISALK